MRACRTNNYPSLKNGWKILLGTLHAMWKLKILHGIYNQILKSYKHSRKDTSKKMHWHIGDNPLSLRSRRLHRRDLTVDKATGEKNATGVPHPTVRAWLYLLSWNRKGQQRKHQARERTLRSTRKQVHASPNVLRNEIAMRAANSNSRESRGLVWTCIARICLWVPLLCSTFSDCFRCIVKDVVSEFSSSRGALRSWSALSSHSATGSERENGTPTLFPPAQHTKSTVCPPRALVMSQDCNRLLQQSNVCLSSDLWEWMLGTCRKNPLIIFEQNQKPREHGRANSTTMSSDVQPVKLTRMHLFVLRKRDTKKQKHRPRRGRHSHTRSVCEVNEDERWQV